MTTMTSPLLAFLIKLPLALAVFLVVAYAGTASKRIAGVLFTFPILNGIAIIASDEPTVVADAIYPLVIFNCVLFAALISFPQMLPPMGALPRWGKLAARVAVWSLAWLAGAVLITSYRNCGFQRPRSAHRVGAVHHRFHLALLEPARPSKRPHRAIRRRGFVAFWTTPTGFWRIAFFVVTYACLFFATHAAADQKWVGMASALPLPGFFALATLIDDAETRRAPMTGLRAIRDTLFLGPVLVIPFNWIFSHALLGVQSGMLRYLLLIVMWAVAACAVVTLVPRLAAYFDRRAS